jgi:hypothetical protein
VCVATIDRSRCSRRIIVNVSHRQPYTITKTVTHRDGESRVLVGAYRSEDMRQSAAAANAARTTAQLV